MPLYMDIHNVDTDNFSIEEVAKSHWEDLAIQEKFGVIQHKYWVDIQNKTIFCLMEGPNKEACNSCHEAAHGGTACNIIEVSDDEFNLFLGKGTKNENDLAQTLSGDVDAGFRTLLLIKIYDFSGKYKHYTNQIHRLLKQYNGNIVLQPNDDILVSFILALDAVTCAIAISDLLRGIPDAYEYGIVLVTGNPVDDEGTTLFQETKEKIKILSEVSLTNTIYMDMATKSLVDKVPNVPKFNSEIFKIITLEYFLLIKKVLNIISSEIQSSEFDIDKLNALLGFSKSQAYRKIKSSTGMPTSRLIQEFRLRQALESIKQHNKTIAEIAYDYGFSSPTYFTRIFKKRFGILPTTYAKNSNNKS